jgi:hypothetical protein
MKLPLLGQSGEDIEDDNSSQLTQNWYPHIASGGKSKLALYPTPGETLFEDIGVGPIRGGINYNGTYFVVSANKFYEVDAAGNYTERGTLNTSIGQVRMDHNGAFNGKQIVIVDGTNGYVYNSEYQTFAQIKQHATGTATAGTSGTNLEDAGTFTTTMVGQVIYNTTDGTKTTITAYVDADNVTVASAIFANGETFEVGTDAFPDGATHIEFIDGYFIFNDPSNSGRFFKSASYDGTDVDSLEFATAERSPDELQGLTVTDKLIWLIGKETSEPWFNSGDPDFPFEPVPSGYSKYGCAAKYSIIEMGGLVAWLSQTKEGNSSIVMAQGIQVSPISTPEICAEIDKMTTISDCYAFSYEKYQHKFMAFTFPSESKTLVYDITTGLWHTWKSKALGYHRSTCCTFVYGKHLVGDPTNGRIYELDWDAYTDNGDAIERKRISTVFHADGKGIDWEVIELDLKEGVGDATTPDPQIHIRWRDDNGAWSNYKSRSMGKVGERNKRVRVRQPGYTKSSRVYEITTSDPVNAVLIDGFARMKVKTKEFR